MAISVVEPEQRMIEAASSDAADVIKQYGSRIEGLYDEELTASRAQYGVNKVSDHSSHVILKRLYHSFVNVFIIVLTIIDILWMVFSPDIVYFIILTTLILVSGAMTFVQETRSSKAAAELISMVTTVSTVRRKNAKIKVDSCDLVVGDILVLDTGDLIPADVRIIESNHLKIDQSALTGESVSASKSADPLVKVGNILECNNLAFMGCHVMEGSAEAVVVAVGDDTVLGSITESVSSRNILTTYDKGSKAIVAVLLKLMFYLIPPVFILMLLKDYINTGTITSEGFTEAVTFAITLAIGLMPEMLATIVSTNLAKGSIDMAKKKAIVKNATSIQNLGAMDILCSDKTGTLTEGRISVESCNDICGNRSSLVEKLVCLNSSKLISSTNQIDWAIQEHAREDWLMGELDKYNTVGDIPFDFVRRRSTVIVKKDEEDCLMISKGAVPEILSISKRYLDENNNEADLDEKTISKLMGMVEWYSKKGMRVLGVTHKYFNTDKKEFTSEDENNLTFAGFIVFTDLVKKTSGKAIKELNEYGVGVKILSGDNEFVTHYVCDNIGIKCELLDNNVTYAEETEILKGGSRIVTGPQIDRIDDEDLKIIVESNDVFVRLTPKNKYRVVNALRENGHCVGFMGDGINDIYAMKNADVSISVDTGTDITKEAANIILLEKDLSILKDGIIEGRKVYANTVKYVKMIGSINFGYMFSLIMATMFFNFEPIGAVMILIFNLINDFACLVIPWDNVEDQFVKEPRKWDAINLKSVMFRYGPMCCVTDAMSWLFFTFAIFGTLNFSVITADGTVLFAEGTYGHISDLILKQEDLSGTNVEAMFQALWCIEQYWMQVWAIHIVRTNGMPWRDSKPAAILNVTTVLALFIGTVLPFTGALWAGISGFPMELFQNAFFTVMPYALIWMPIIALVYFFGSHLVKKRMLRTHGYFAC